MLTTIAGIYENGRVQFREAVPNYKKCDVFITFLPKKNISSRNKSSNKMLFEAGPLYDATKTTLTEKLDALDYLSGLCKGSTITDEEIKNRRLARQ